MVDLKKIDQSIQHLDQQLGIYQKFKSIRSNSATDANAEVVKRFGVYKGREFWLITKSANDPLSKKVRDFFIELGYLILKNIFRQIQDSLETNKSFKAALVAKLKQSYDIAEKYNVNKRKAISANDESLLDNKSQLAKKCLTLITDNENLIKKIEELSRISTETNDQIARNQTEFEQKLSELEQKLAKSNHEHEEAAGCLNNSLAKMREEKAEVSRQLEALQRDFKERIDGKHAELVAALKQLEEKNASIAQLKADIEHSKENETKLAALQGQLEKEIAEKNALDAHKSALEVQVIELGAKYTTKENELAIAKQELESLQKREEAFLADIKTEAAAKVASLNDTIGELELLRKEIAELRDVKEQLGTFQEENVNLAKGLEEARETIRELQSKSSSSEKAALVDGEKKSKDKKRSSSKEKVKSEAKDERGRTAEASEKSKGRGRSLEKLKSWFTKVDHSKAGEEVATNEQTTPKSELVPEEAV